MEAKDKDLKQESEQTTVEETNINETEAPQEEQNATLEEQLEKLQIEHGALKDKYLRMFAEFDNYKKRTVKERLDLMKTAGSDTISALLPVLDDFDRAKRNAEDEQSKEPFSEGVSLVYQKLYSALKAKGLSPMESNGEAFDPELHEAITEIPTPNEEMKGKIIDTVERGYFLNEKIIRYAKVVVGK